MCYGLIRTRNPLTVFILLFTLCVLTTYYISLFRLNLYLFDDVYVMRFQANNANISCHYDTKGDVLVSAEDDRFYPSPNSIFFHETSCKGGLNSRQACAVESAARAHPRRRVYVLFSAPVNRTVLTRSCMAKLRELPNVRFARIHVQEYARDTPLQSLIERAPFKGSEWWIEHTSDILRYLTLYKWGGLYLDTDMMVIKSLTPLGHNWVAREDEGLVNSAAIAISTDHLGRKLAFALVREINSTYRPDIWKHNGPGAITRVLHKFCTTSNMADWGAHTCHGLEVYGPEYFYPIHYSRNGKYFRQGDLPDYKDAYTHHFWNKMTYGKRIEKDSPYDRMAREFCPSVYEMYGDEFGY